MAGLFGLGSKRKPKAAQGKTLTTPKHFRLPDDLARAFTVPSVVELAADRDAADTMAEDRAKLLKRVPDTVADLIAQFAETKTTEQDQLVLTSLDTELKAAGLDWTDLANLLRFQIVAHRRASMQGVIQAARTHPNKMRLNDWELKFLGDIHRRDRLLTARQMTCLQSIIDSLNLSEDDYALRVASAAADLRDGLREVRAEDGDSPF